MWLWRLRRKGYCRQWFPRFTLDFVDGVSMDEANIGFIHQESCHLWLLQCDRSLQTERTRRKKRRMAASVSPVPMDQNHPARVQSTEMQSYGNLACNFPCVSMFFSDILDSYNNWSCNIIQIYTVCTLCLGDLFVWADIITICALVRRWCGWR
jgi:hypothetical protein